MSPVISESPPGSPLSSHASSEFAEDIKTDDREHSADSLDQVDTHLMPPSKRRKTGQASYRSTSVTPLADEEDTGDISSDTEGSIPSSELGAMDDDHHEQVTVCKWEGCPAGDLGNMDVLVRHIHQDHMSPRQKKWTCQWIGCQRQGSEHASGYALRGHMRSHTKEKPFICFLPECDRSFTRSDALAKHLRTVHETDNPRPSDPVPKGQTSTQKPQRLKLVLKDKPPASEHTDMLSSPHPPNIKEEDAADGQADDDDDDDATLPRTRSPSPMPNDLDWTPEELNMTPSELFRRLRRQVHWAEHTIGADLKAECESLERKKVEEWRRKELVYYNWLEAELALAEEHRVGHPDEGRRMRQDLPHPALPLVGPMPWYRPGKADEGQQGVTDEVGRWVEGVGDQGGVAERTAEV